MQETRIVSGYLTREQAAEYLGICPRTVSELQRKRLIPHVKLAKKCVRFRPVDLDRAMDRLTVKAVG